MLGETKQEGMTATTIIINANNNFKIGAGEELATRAMVYSTWLRAIAAGDQVRRTDDFALNGQRNGADHIPLPDGGRDAGQAEGLPVRAAPPSLGSRVIILSVGC